MKKWIKRSLMAVLGATVVAGGIAACSSHRMSSHWGGGDMSATDRGEWRERMVERAGSKLDLDAAQKLKLSALAQTLAEQRKTVMGETTDPRAEVRALIAGERFDRDRAQALVNDKTAALREASPAVIGATGDFFDSLNAEQQQKLRELLARGGRHRGGHS